MVWGYNRLGPESLGDGRHQNFGSEPLLNDVQQAQLWQALQGDAPDGGLWNGRKVADWMSELLGLRVSPFSGVGVSTRHEVQTALPATAA